MPIKADVKALITELATVQNNLNELQKKLTDICLAMPEDFIDNSTVLMVTLKYTDIVYSDTTSWDKLIELPRPILIEWDLRLRSAYSNIYSDSALENQIGKNNVVKLRNYVWDLESYVHGLIIHSTGSATHLQNVKQRFSSLTLPTREQVERYFLELKEEILKFENQ